MRTVLSILLIFFVPFADAQVGDKDLGQYVFQLEEPDGTVRTVLRLPYDVVIDKKMLEELMKRGPSPTRCQADYSDIEAEKEASNARFRAMKDKLVPLKHQYEQELYFGERMQKRFDETCGEEAKAIDPSFRSSFPESVDMTKKACEAIGEACKPMKHW